MKQPRYWLVGVLVACCLAISANAQFVTQAQNYTATTWTPTLTGASTAGTGQTYSTQVGTCEVIGRQVTIRWFIVATSLGTAAGGLQVNGFSSPCGTPTTTANDYGPCGVPYYVFTGLAALNYGVGGIITPNSTVVALQQNGNASVAALTAAQAGNSATFVGWCSYHTGA